MLEVSAVRLHACTKTLASLVNIELSMMLWSTLRHTCCKRCFSSSVSCTRVCNLQRRFNKNQKWKQTISIHKLYAIKLSVFKNLIFLFVFSSRFAINLNHKIFLKGSGRTYLRCGGKYYAVLLEILSSFQQWQNFENRLRFEKVIAKSLVASFFGTQYAIQATSW